MSDYNKFYNAPSNYNRLLNNPNFIDRMLSIIRNKLGRLLLPTEKEYIINYLQNMNPNFFNNHPDVIMKKIVVDIVEKISKSQCYDEITDVHEMLKSEIGVSTDEIRVESDTDFTQQITNNFSNTVDIASILGTKSLTDLKNLIAPGASLKRAYILLDSRYRTLDNDGKNNIKWIFTNNSNVTQGSVNAIGDIQNIVSMKVSSFKIPFIDNADNPAKRITMYIQELSAQSVIAQEGRQYHFMFPITVEDRFINLEVQRESDGVFRFRSPVARIDTLTISFAAPLQLITFDSDRRNMRVESYGNVITFVSADPHKLESGDIVYITYFTKANPNADANIISAVNNVNGVTVIFVDETRIAIDVDTTLLRYTGSGTITVTNASNAITGTGTTFLTTFVVNDIIDILGIRYTVVSILSDTQLTINTEYVGTSGTGLSYSKSNNIPNLNPSFYFGAKRMFIPMEFEYMG